jgi:hypothetical protein
MTPEASLAKQIELYRAMTGEQRLKIALDLHEFACNVTRSGILHQHPDWDEEQGNRELRRRIEIARDVDRRYGF